MVVAVVVVRFDLTHLVSPPVADIYLWTERQAGVRVF